jgi:hypothetical protein
MSYMDGWDWLLLVIGSFFALSTLVSLMRARRNVVLDEISAHAASEKRRKDQKQMKTRK